MNVKLCLTQCDLINIVGLGGYMCRKVVIFSLEG